MQLIGFRDSPYVRRTAVSLRLLGLPFEHRVVSVFRHFDEFRSINPVVKAPTLVCDDGTILMDSGLILEHLARIAPDARPLMPLDAAEHRRACRVIGLALAACEKSVSIVYEKEQRPAEKRHEPWLDRVTGQLLSACRGLEDEIARRPPACTSSTIEQDGITTAVTWGFVQMVVPGVVAADAFPRVRDFAAEAERLAEFRAFPPV